MLKPRFSIVGVTAFFLSTAIAQGVIAYLFH